MYLTLDSANTDYFLGSYTQVISLSDQNKIYKTYTFDIGNNLGENYTTFSTNKIEMKGFLAGYKIQQGRANGLFLNFTLKPKNATFFTI